MPSHPIIENALNHLASAAQTIVSQRGLLKHDIAGRIYHTLLLQNVAKGLATYYTSIPAAYVLAKLAVEEPGLDVDWTEIQSDPVVIADFACGSGTLLSAAYSAVLDAWISGKMDANETVTDEQLQEFHKAMLEHVLHGLDVLSYAVHLSAAWLTLRMPDTRVEDMHMLTVPLRRGNRGSVRTWLGSLSILTEDDQCQVPLATTLFGEESGAEAGGLSGVRSGAVSFDKPSLIIMNPPFARTGNAGHSLLLGHLPDEERAAVLAGLRDYFGRADSALGGSIGKAGLASGFVWLADRALKENGRLAFVLPRVALSGPSWEPIRRMLATYYKIDHIVVSYDPRHKWAWSENTDLSEILLVCTKQPAESRRNSEFNVKVSYIFRRPRSAPESKVLASRLMQSEPAVDEDEVISLGRDPVATIYRIPQERLSRQRNWNVCTSFASARLTRLAYRIHQLDHRLGIPLVSLNDAVEMERIENRLNETTQPAIGYDVATFGHYRNPRGGLRLAVLEGANVETLNRLRTTHTGEISFLEQGEFMRNRMSRFLIAGVARLRLNSIGVLSVLTERQVISSSCWTVRLKGDQNLDRMKAQVAWLNSTFGLLGLLSLRQDSSGAFVQLKKEYVPMIKLLDFDSLRTRQRNELVSAFDELADEPFQSIPDQIAQAMQGRGARFELDRRVSRAIDTNFNLNDIYARMSRETVITGQVAVPLTE
jgi:hypothetical protein